MPENCRIPLIGEVLIHHNPIAKAIFAHKSQKNEWNTLGILNSDEVFFERRTDNLVFTAQIKATSGDCSKIKDFQIINTDDIDASPPKFSNHLWIPDLSDKEKTLILTWSCLQQIEQIKIYGDVNSESESNKLEISFDDNHKSEIKLPKHGRAYVMEFDDKLFVNTVKFKLLDNNFGISEIEIFANKEPPRIIKPFIKITIDDNFVYDYFVPMNKQRLELEIYRFHTDKPLELTVSDGVIYYADNKFTLQFDNDNVTVRAEIADEPEIYDQIRIHRKSCFYFWRLKLKQLFERFKIHLQRKFRGYKL